MRKMINSLLQWLEQGDKKQTISKKLLTVSVLILLLYGLGYALGKALYYINN